MQPSRLGLIAFSLIGPMLSLGLAGSPARAADDATGPLDERVSVGPEANGAKVQLDTTTFLPVGPGPHPAVLLTHGFGGSKDDVVAQARDLADAGYVVLTYSARGFGDSAGMVHVADPDFEIADSRALIDVLAERDDVVKDAAGDPRVALVGESYGGAIALMTAATDDRVDTVAAAITWNNLADAFFPETVLDQNVLDQNPGTMGAPAEVDPIDTFGPLKQLWASRFFLGTSVKGASTQSGTGADPVCGRFAPEVCEPFLESANTGRPNPELLDLFAAHSPAPLLEGLTAPTYLIQGMADSLFGVEQSDAITRTLTEQGTAVAVRWMDGGHDGPSSTATADAKSIETWLAAYLDTEQPATEVALPLPPFVFAKARTGRQDTADLSRTTKYVDSATWESVEIDSAPQPVLNPPGGQPSSI